jgi:HAD superfamily hydrolase (TIGR01509 family)
MTLEAVLFDLFDTLILVDREEVFYPPSLKKLHTFLSEQGVNVSFPEFQRVYFEVRERLYAATLTTLEEPHFHVRVAQTLQRLGHPLSETDPLVVGATRAFADALGRYVHLDAEAPTVLQRLRGTYKLGVVSNFGIPEWAHRLLAKYQLTPFLDVVVISAEVNRRKPSPAIFDHALTALGVTPSRAVFIGDTPNHDVKGPQNVGMKAILIKRRPVELDTGVKPDRVITHLTEVPGAVDALS